MKIVKASYEILDKLNKNIGQQMIEKIELCGRVCYKSEDRINGDSAKKFVKSIITRGHESVLEHESVTVKFIVDRGISHQIVRHRIASYSQESQRYVNYRGCVEIIEPCYLDKGTGTYFEWLATMEAAVDTYNFMLDRGCTPEEARATLPNSTKTELIVTMNLRSWRNFFKLRTSHQAHPQMIEVAVPLLRELQELIPIVFDDIETKGDVDNE